MYYITPKDSETGKKFAQVEERMKQAQKQQVEMANKYGFSQWRGSRIFKVLNGGISSCLFEAKPDPKIWKEIEKNEYMPRLNTKQGKAIQADFDKMLTPTIWELNGCIGYDDVIRHIGFNMGDEYFGFTIGENWDDVKIPNDCEEVTYSKYLELFNRKNDDQAHPSPES